jgi:hypothetical protein
VEDLEVFLQLDSEVFLPLDMEVVNMAVDMAAVDMVVLLPLFRGD